MADPHASLDDASLVAAARGGDARAFETLLRRHESRVLRILRLLGIAPDDRQDVAQEVFLRVFRGLEGYKPGHAFEGWIYRVSVNASLDHRAGARQRERRESAWPEGLDRADEGGEGTPADLAQRDLARRLETALATLPERERDVFVLRELEGLDTKAVAKLLGITSITVRRHTGRARERLRTLLGASAEKKSGGR